MFVLLTCGWFWFVFIDLFLIHGIEIPAHIVHAALLSLLILGGSFLV